MVNGYFQNRLNHTEFFHLWSLLSWLNFSKLLNGKLNYCTSLNNKKNQNKTKITNWNWMFLPLYKVWYFIVVLHFKFFQLITRPKKELCIKAANHNIMLIDLVEAFWKMELYLYRHIKLNVFLHSMRASLVSKLNHPFLNKRNEYGVLVHIAAVN